jgi:hypothetical protein
VSVTTSEVRFDALRCPACGQRFRAPFPERCTLCDFDFGFSRDAATGTDFTPYARAFAHGESGWRVMCTWVWLAGTARLKHLALMRMSAASARFCRANFLLLAGALTLVQATRIGWRTVCASPTVEPTGVVEPRGRGWLHLAAAPEEVRAALSPDKPVDLWWNPAQTIIGGVFAGLFALLLTWLVLLLIRFAVTRAHAPMYEAEGRMSAALHYGTAWVVPVVAGGLFFLLMPLHHIGVAERWSWHPSAQMIWVLAGILAGFGLMMWWFWLVRLGLTAPAEPRARVVTALIGGASVSVAAAAALWWFGVDLFCRIVFIQGNLEF